VLKLGTVVCEAGGLLEHAFSRTAAWSGRPSVIELRAMVPVGSPRKSAAIAGFSALS
jgi:hypothetical protein